MSKILNFSLFLLLILGISACNNNNFDIALDQEIETQSYRFDQEFMQTDTSKVKEAIDLYYQKYPIFFPTYTYGVIKAGGMEQKNFPNELKRFITDPTMNEVYQEIQKQFEDVDQIKQEIDKALSYYHHYFPEEAIPELFFIQSGFNQRIIVDSLVLGVALDMCLGANNDYYKQLSLPIYMSKKLNRENIAIDAMRAMAWSNFTFDGEDNLASNMIYEGKIQYFMDALFPECPTAKKLSYSEADLAWVNQNEEDIWSAIIQGEMLYQTDYMKIKNMIENAPFTQAFGNKSPSKIGIWLGWEIVKSYMDEHPEISLQELMLNKDYISILNESNYMP